MAIKKTKCYYCGKEICVTVQSKHTEVGGCSCNDCVSKNSPSRNGIDESLFTECPITYRIRKAKERIEKFRAQNGK